MGKGKRTKKNLVAEQEFLKEKDALERRKKKKNNIRAIIITAAIVLIGAGIIFGSIEYKNLEKDGYFLRKKAVLSTDNYSVNVPMMEYFFNTVVSQYTQQYSSYLSQIGLDTSKNLKDQACGIEEGKTWYQYFEANSKSEVENLLVLCEAAEKDGMKLETADENTIKENIKSMEKTAEESGLTLDEYIKKTYGSDVNREDVEDAVRIITLANNYKTKYEDSLKFSNKELNSYFDEHKDTFLNASYYSYLIPNNATGKEKSDELKSLNAKAKATAEDIADASSEKTFTDKLEKAIKESLKKSDPSVKGEDLTNAVSEQMQSATAQTAYDTSTESGKWLFSEKRKAGDTAVFKDPEGNGYYVYYMLTPAKKDDAETKSVRHILVSSDDYDSDTDAKKAADKILKEWLNGEKTEDSFGKLATQYTTDPGSKSTGGLYENVPAGQMVTEFNDWMFDKSRKVGDTDVIKTDYGYHVMYFVGDGLSSWESTAMSSLKSESYNKRLEELLKKYKVTADDGNFALINQVYTESTSSESATANGTY